MTRTFYRMATPPVNAASVGAPGIGGVNSEARNVAPNRRAEWSGWRPPLLCGRHALLWTDRLRRRIRERPGLDRRRGLAGPPVRWRTLGPSRGVSLHSWLFARPRQRQDIERDPAARPVFRIL